MLFRALASAAAVLAVAAPAAAAAPTLFRSGVGPADDDALAFGASGGIELEISSRAAEGVVFTPAGAAATPWAIDAPDCTQDALSFVVTCTGLVALVQAQTGRGDDLIDARESPAALSIGTGAGDDTILGTRLDDDRLETGAGADSVVAGPGDDGIEGGPGDDFLQGGPGNDVLKGSPGSDRLFGEDGIDRLLARDSEADRSLTCGGGSNSRESAKVDAQDPKAKSC